MADLTLERPQAGQQVEINNVADARLVLNFPTEEATLARVGDNLVFNFADGGSLVLDNFYTAYTKESLPDFLIEGQAVSGDQFFAALGEDLLPAAGPAAAAAADGGRFSEYSDAAFMGGIDRLNGLDLGFNNNPQVTEDLNAYGRDGSNAAQTLAGTAPDSPTQPTPPPANLIPEVSDQYGTVVEDDPTRNKANGNSLTGSVTGDGEHSLTWAPENAAQHGSFTQNPDGTFSYELNNEDGLVQALGPNESLQEVFEFTYTDQNGDAATGRVIITINGVNDPLVVTTEGQGLSLNVKESGVGKDGDPMAEVGQDHISDGGGKDHSFTVSDKDANDQQHVSIGVSAKNIVQGEGGDTVATDFDPSANTSTDENGVITITTPDGTFTLTPVTTTDEFGGKSVTYTYSYNLNDSSDAVNALNQGQSHDYTFTITVTDNNGSTVTQPVTVHVEGTNDVPKLSIADGKGHIEVNDVDGSAASNVTGEGKLHVSDADADGQQSGDKWLDHEFKIEGGENTTGTGSDGGLGNASSFETGYGTLTVNPDGTYTFEPNESSIAKFGEGEGVKLSFDVTAYDKHGANSETQTITVDISGHNDGPQIDIDGGSNKEFTLKEAGVGSKTEAEHWNNGNAGYSPDGANNHQIKGVDKTGEHSFTVTDVDANDSQTLAVDNGKGPQSLTFDAATGTVTVESAYGAMTIKVTGFSKAELSADGKSITFTPEDAGTGVDYSYSYTMNAGKTDFLNPFDPKSSQHAEGFDFVKEHFELKVTDSAGKDLDGKNPSVDITIEGTNDVPKILWSAVEVKEDGVFGGNAETTDDPFKPGDNPYIDHKGERDVVSGNIPSGDGKGGDPDAGAKIDYGIGGLWLSSDSWNPATDRDITLKDYANKNDIMQKNPDGSETAVSLSAKILNTDTFTQVDENGHQTIVTNYGILDLNTNDGSYTFTLGADADSLAKLGIEDADAMAKLINDAINGLAEGEVLNLSFQASATDQYGAKSVHGINVVIKGSNDKPTLALDKPTDIDGNVEIGADGVPVFDVQEGLNPGEKGDQPVINDGPVNLGTVAKGDVDRGADTHFGLAKGHPDGEGKDYAPTDNFAKGDENVTIKGDYGTLTIDKNGNLSYKVDNTLGGAADKLGTHWDEALQKYVPDTANDSFTIYVKDEHGAWTEQQITVRVNGVNDPPRLVTGDQATVSESGVKDGNLPDIKPEESSHGQLRVTDSDSDVNQLDFSITGVRNNATTSAPGSGATVDGPDGFTGYVVDQGTLFINDKGEFYFELNNSDPKVNQLGNGQTLQLQFNVSVKDAEGASNSTWLTINVKGTNDRPTLELVDKDLSDSHITVVTNTDVNGVKTTDATLTMTEDEGSYSGTASGKDVDSGHKLSFGVAKGEIGDANSTDRGDLSQAFEGENGMGAPKTSVEGDYGNLSIKADGTYTYTPKENLAHGKEYQESFTIFVRDEHGAWQQQHLTVKVTGSADAPVIQGSVPNAMVAEVTESGVHFNTNDSLDASVSGKGTGVVSDTEFKLGSFKATQTDNNSSGHGDLKAGFITSDGTFHEGKLETDYGTLHITINAAGEAVYSFIMPEEGSDAAKAFNALTPEDRIKLFDNLKVGIYDSAHAELVGASGGKFDENGNFSFTIDGGHANLIPNQSVDIYVHGSNDRPVFVDKDGKETTTVEAQISEDGGSATGTLHAHDYDTGTKESDLRFSIVDDKGNLVQVIQGKYGLLTLNQETGEYSYKLTVNPADYQHLNPGELLGLEDFTVRVSDPLNAYTDAKLNVKVEGNKDDAKLDGKDIQVSEDSGTPNIVGSDTPTSDEASLKLTITDDHHGSDGAYKLNQWSVNGKELSADGSPQTITGAHGNLVLSPDGNGSWTYKYELTGNESSTIQKMALGESRTESFVVEVKNANGESVKETITVTIKGANDKPLLDSVTSEGSVKAGVFEKDADTSDTDNPGVIFTGKVNGHDTDNALDQNGKPIEGKTEGVSYHFVVTGENGELVTTDVVKTEFGSFIMNPATGEYKYILDNENVNHQDLTGKFDRVQVVVQDIHGAQSEPKEIVIELNNADGGGSGGAGDGLSFSKGDLQGAVLEDGALTPSDNVDEPSQIFTGHLDAKYGDGSDAGDKDHVFGLQDGDKQIQTQVTGDYGYLTINPATGDYTYTLFNGQDGQPGAVQFLAKGETHNERFTLMLNGQVVKDADGKDVTIEITITGSNDKPVIDGFISDSGHQITEGVVDNEGHWSGIVKGNVDAHDIDGASLNNGVLQSGTDTLTYGIKGGEVGENGKVSFTLDGKGTLTLDPATGEYTFKVDSNHEHLTLGAQDKLTFTITVDDGKGGTATKDLTITLNGVNLGPDWVLGSENENLQITEDSQTSATSGKLEGLLFTDDEGAAKLTYSLSDAAGAPKVSLAHGDYGTLIFNPDGSYTYILDNQSKEVQGLRQGETKTESFKVTVWDEHGASKTVEVKVDVHGTNDVPVATVDHVIVTKEGEEGGSAQITASDADGETLAFTFDQAAVDAHNAKAAPDRQWTLNADGSSLSTEYGTYTVGQDGKVSFTLDKSSGHVIGLGAGQLVEQNVTVSISDGSEKGTINQQVTVNIEGSNTAPEVTKVVVNGDDTPLVEDAAQKSFSGSVTASDADQGDKVAGYMFMVDGKLVSSVKGDYGSISIDSEGKYIYTLDKDLSQSLAQDQVEHDSFTVVAVDGYGKPSAGANVDISIKGTNDAPAIDAAVSKADNRGSLTFHDVDTNDSHSLSIVIGDEKFAVENGRCEIPGKGVFELTPSTDASGKITWNYTFTPNGELAGNIALGKNETLHFKFEVKDSSGAANSTANSKDLTVTINGTNTPPQIGQAALLMTLAAADLVPDSPFTVSSDSALPSIDADGDKISYAFTGMENGDVKGDFGTLHFNAETGGYSYTLDTSAENLAKLAQHHANGGEMDEHFTFTASDAVAGSDPSANHEVTVSLAPPAMTGGALGDAHSSTAQSLFGGGEGDTLHGGSGNDILSGGGGDDQLFGGDGDDILFGGDGDDYLSGGTGQNQLYGGDGNDILVYSPDNSLMDGGDGIDFLIGASQDTIEGLLSGSSADNPVKNVEVFITEGGDGLTNMTDLSKIGIEVKGDSLHLGDGWTLSGNADGHDGYNEYTYTGSDGGQTTILVQDDLNVQVQKAMLENNNG